jgi:ankyrin repeat protein
MAPASLAATNQKANSDLQEAVKAGDESKVVAALAQPGVDVNCCDEGFYGYTPLLLACNPGDRILNTSVVRLLLQDSRVNVDARDIQGQTALHSWRGENPLEEILLSKRTDIDWNAADMIGQTPLLWFARGDDEELVRRLIGVESVNLFATTIDGFTALHQVAERETDSPYWMSKRYKIVDLMLEEVGRRGHNVVSFVDATDILNRSALHYIAEEGHFKILELLCKFSANMNVNGVDFHGFTPLHLAVRNGHDAVVERLLQLPSIDANVRATVNASNPDKLKPFEEPEYPICRPNLFLKTPKEQPGRDLTPLHFAVMDGRMEVVRLLLEWEGINIDAVDSAGLTPLQYSVQNGHWEIVELLLKKGKPFATLNIDAVDSTGRTPLHSAVMHGRMEVVRLLLEWEGINIDAVDSAGLTPLQYSVQSGHSEMVELLLKKGKPFATLDYDRQCGVFEDLLHLATALGEKTIAIQLLNTLGSGMSAFADISTKFSSNQSFTDQSRLLASAAVSNQFEIIKYIVKWQPEVNVNETSECAAIPDLVATPLHFAVVEGDVATVGGPKRGHVEAVQEVLEHPKLDVNAQDNKKMTPLLYAIDAGNVDMVKVLCQKDQFHRLRATEENSAGHTPLQIVVEDNNRNEDPNMKAIEKILLERPEVKDFVDRLYRDRHVFVDAANALLVGAALIASVTFAGWLQSPLGYIPYYDLSQPFPAPPGAYESYAAIKQNPKVKAFSVFNSLSFLPLQLSWQVQMQPCRALMMPSLPESSNP